MSSARDDNASERNALVGVTVALALLVAAGPLYTLSFDGSVPVQASAPLAPGTRGAIDAPPTEAIVADTLQLSGWALDRVGIASIEVEFDGAVLEARRGIARPDVAAVMSGYPHAATSGYELTAAPATLRPLRHIATVTAVNAEGARTPLGRRSVIPTASRTQWTSGPAADRESRPFFFLMATSGVAQGGAGEVESLYKAYESTSVRVGIAVPVLYLRTTKGVHGDWAFDPDFDTSVKCGERRIADDSLNGVLRYAVERNVPVQFILNGGIWADAACDVPQWDVNDALEDDVRNCQWTQDDQVPEDDYLKNLAGSLASPELGRSLALNVYASKVRQYKQRNLQQAAALIAAFARAHPDLFVGINLDSDTYLNPFYEHRQWFDYNPDTLRQFRHWLRGTGPYAGEPGEPDLRAYRRAPMSLDAVSKLAQRRFRAWGEVDPPRRFPGPREALRKGEPVIWDDPWYRTWDTFRKHLVDLHYDELSQWAHDAGIARERIFSAQGFVAPEAGLAPFALRITSAGQNYDSGGVSVEGAVPKAGHLGAILYGKAARNDVRMEDRHGLFSTFARLDPGWAVVEANLAELREPAQPAGYEAAYRAFRDLWNYDARQVSLMAWNGSNGIYAGQPGYVAYTSWRNTPAEEAMRDFMVTHAALAPGSRLWTFGSVLHKDTDGWRAEEGSLEAAAARLTLRPERGRVVLVSPPDQVIRRGNGWVLDLRGQGLKRDAGLRVWARASAGGAWLPMGPAEPAIFEHGRIQAPLGWPPSLPSGAIVEQVKLEFLADDAASVAIDTLALLPR